MRVFFSHPHISTELIKYGNIKVLYKVNIAFLVKNFVALQIIPIPLAAL